MRLIHLLHCIQCLLKSEELKNGEDDELSAEESKLSGFEKLYSEIERINNLLSGDENASIIPCIKRVRSASERASSLDKNLENLDSRVESAFYEISDIAEEFNSYAGSLIFDPARLEQVQDRLALIYNLKKKYASSQSAGLSEVLDYSQNAKD